MNRDRVMGKLNLVIKQVTGGQFPNTEYGTESWVGSINDGVKLAVERRIVVDYFEGDARIARAFPDGGVDFL